MSSTDNFEKAKAETATMVASALAARVERIQSGQPIEEVSLKDAHQAMQRTLNINTRNAFRGMGIKNYEANSPVLKAGRGVIDFEDKTEWQRKPAFLVGAGPCLEKNASSLSRVKGRYPILACDAAYKPLMERHGIVPDLVFCVDIKDHQKDLWAGLDTSQSCLITCSAVDPSTIESWQGEIRFFNTLGDDKEAEHLQLKYGKQFGTILVGGNVSSAMMTFARMYLHANPQVFVGHDYSFPLTGQYYCLGANHDRAAWSKDVMEHHDIDGERVLTDISLYSYAVWTEDMVRSFQDNFREHGLPIPEFINATEGGILGTVSDEPGENSDAYDYMTLDDAIDRCDEITGSISLQATCKEV